jgi:hypothetical protein
MTTAGTQALYHMEPGEAAGQGDNVKGRDGVIWGASDGSEQAAGRVLLGCQDLPGPLSGALQFTF